MLHVMMLSTSSIGWQTVVLRGNSEAHFSMPNSVGCFHGQVVQKVTVAMHTDEGANTATASISRRSIQDGCRKLHSNRMTGKY